jgi:hypothetical protein
MNIQTEFLTVLPKTEATPQTALEALDTVRALTPDWFPPFESAARHVAAQRWAFAPLEARAVLAYARTDPAALSHTVAGLHCALARFAAACDSLADQERRARLGLN